MLTFQDLIFKLLKFWGDHGCILEQGHDVETGAGTFNPSTFLRSLGPEPYNSVYVEPSRRPQDGRYGENPNRLQLFHQLQVVMKPSPPNIQELYLESLKVIGFDLTKHDIRFVHDDWESPTLGAWGLGWEVWIDGMEVTQYTYFQQVAGYALSPVTVEITYGLERLCMFIQKVDNVLDMKWNDSLTYGDLCYKRELEWSTYNFERSNPEMWKRHFDDFEKEALAMIQQGLPLPAYDFVIKASHAFNMLEARGVISVTERTGYIQRVRNLSLEIATAYLEGRKKDHFPLLKESAAAGDELIIEPKLPKSFDASKSADFLLEIGSEELPAAYIPGAMLSLQDGMQKALDSAGLAHDKIEVFGTPRRLSLLVRSLAEGKAPSESERRGPPISIAFDPSGEPTKQGIGFFASVGLKPMHKEKIEGVKIVDGYLYATIKSEGCSTIELLSKILPSLILDIKFPKKMRWGSLDIAYARPLRWIVALYDHHIVPFHLAEITSSNKSFGHAQLAPKEILLKSPEEYVSKLRKHEVLVAPQDRETSILNQLKEIEEKHNVVCRDVERVMKEVVYLSEWPQLAFHFFDKSFLRAPDEVLVSEMVEHQRYFPLYNSDGTLSNHFVITADNTPNPVILRNNLSVLSARLADGTFLYEQDLKNSLEEFNEKLKTVTFQKELGSLYEKVKRLVEISEMVCLALHHKDCETVKRAALLCKADLASDLVGEFPDLQGIIGKHYALHQNESHEVALAIEEHYLPKVEGGPLPLSSTGLILSLTDKIDNLLGYFSVGLKPTSSSDPYAIRRQSIGLLKILIENELSVNLEELLFKATAVFPKLKGHIHNQKSVVAEILDYLTARAKVLFLDYEFKKDEIEASIQGLCIDPYDQFLKTKALNNFRSHADFPKLFEVYKRAKGQLEKQEGALFKLDLAHEPQEKNLAEQLAAIGAKWQTSHDKRDYESSFSLLASLKQPLADLFDNVKILADDPEVRANRLALIREVFSHFDLLLDFSKIQD